MLIKIGEFDCSECWDGVFYKKLANYPYITEWEIQTILDFESYEQRNGRKCTIEATDSIVRAIDNYRSIYEAGERVAVPKKITECVACPRYKGCMTDFVCHTAPIENAVKIFECGALQAPTKWRGVPASVLKAESRNAANDPEEYLSTYFTPGVRFFFRYDEIVKHPNATFEGVLPLKIKEEVKLSDWVDTIIIPSAERAVFKAIIPYDLESRTLYLDNDCTDIWEWSEKVYEFVKSREH